MLKKLIKPFVRRLMPYRYWSYQLHRFRYVDREPELALVHLLTDPSKTAVDVGAAKGLYVAHVVDSSKDCIAFEPLRSASASLEAMVTALNLPVRIEEVALSNVGGRVDMRIYDADRGRSTIEEKNELEDTDASGVLTIDVPVKRLDDYQLDSVGFLKIDVEGHEVAVLEGSLETIRQHRPNLIVEVEDRHKPGAVQDVFELMTKLDYAGFFIHEGEVKPIAQFDGRIHQEAGNISGWKTGYSRSGTYVNNFIFVPEEAAARFLSEAGNVQLSSSP